MTPTTLPDPIYIADAPRLAELVNTLASVEKLAVDTEANSLYAYQAQVCLIQLSTQQRDFIVDPLQIEDLAPLGQIFYNPDIEKIFHASEFDINILYDDFGFQFQNLFDTMMAARILGRKKLGLDALLKEIGGIESDKRYQRADWGKRPLPEDMIRYAQKDTHYLIEIRNALAEELRRKGRWAIAQEDFTRAAQAYSWPRKEKLPPCWRINGSQDLPPQKAAILEKLCQFRDQVARERDQPLFKVLGNKTLLSLAEAAPKTRKRFESLSVTNKPQVRRYKNDLWQAIQEGWDASPLLPPEKKRPDDAYLDRLHAIPGDDGRAEPNLSRGPPALRPLRRGNPGCDKKLIFPATMGLPLYALHTHRTQAFAANPQRDPAWHAAPSRLRKKAPAAPVEFLPMARTCMGGFPRAHVLPTG